jgi:hypothetical protein
VFVYANEGLLDKILGVLLRPASPAADPIQARETYN